MNHRLSIFLLLCLCLAFSPGQAQQIQMPQASPSAEIGQKVGLTDVKVAYSRPSVKGRKIFGTLVPYGEVWRTGANASTKVTFSNEVNLEGKSVPAGTYALYTIPNKKEWTIILSKNLELWGSIGYQQEDDAARFTVSPEKTKEKYETMEISFTDMNDTGATLSLKWEKTKVDFRIETEVDGIVMKQIKELVIDGEAENPGLYYQAASYYFNTGKDLKTAHSWITRSVQDDPKYWTVHLKAKIEDQIGLRKEAIKSAQQSLELAKKEKNMDYVGLNERLIKSIQ